MVHVSVLIVGFFLLSFHLLTFTLCFSETFLQLALEEEGCLGLQLIGAVAGTPGLVIRKRMQGAVERLLVFDEEQLREVEQALDKDLNDVYAELRTYQEKQKVWCKVQLPGEKTQPFPENASYYGAFRLWCPCAVMGLH